MPRIPIHNIGSIGVVRDLPPHLLAPEAWSNAQNIRFQDNKVLKFTGHSAVFGPPSIAPHWALAVQTATDTFWLYAGLAKVFMLEQGGVHTDITRAIGGDYTGAASDKWNGGILAGIPVITNGLDVPQSWSPISVSQVLVDLPNWPAATTAKYMRAFKNFLVALHITESGIAKPHMVKWSHPADPGAVPSSWDAADATSDAGEVELSDSQAGVIQDARLLRDILVIYKDNSTWGMQHIGGRFIFRFFPMFASTGILTNRCVSALPNASQHFVMTGDDLIIHNGQSIESVVDKLWKRFINNNINPDRLAASFTLSNPIEDEMWFCFAEIGSTLPSLAITWSTKTGAIGIRELSEAAFIAEGVVDETGVLQSWNSDAQAWDDDASTWQARQFFPQALSLLQLDPTNTKLFKLDDTNQFNLANMTSFVEREGIALVGTDRNGRPKVDVSRRKLAKRVWVKAEGGPFEVRVGSQQFIDGPITYEPAVTFTPGTDQYVDASANGPLLAIRFQSSTNVGWELHGYDMDIELLGEI